MKNVRFFVQVTPLLLLGEGDINGMEMRPECCFGHQYRRKKYFQQRYTGIAVF